MDQQEILKKVATTAIQTHDLDMLKFAFDNGLKEDPKVLLTTVFYKDFEPIVTYLVEKCKENRPASETTAVAEKVKEKRPLDCFIKMIYEEQYLQAEKDLDDGLVSKEEMDYRYGAGYTALSLISTELVIPNDVALVTKLLKAGANVNVLSCGETPLMYACRSSKEKIVKLLLEDPKINVNKISPFRLHVLMLAFNENTSLEVMEMLLGHPDINVNATGNRTVLSYGLRDIKMYPESKYKNKAKIQLLLNHPKIDLNIRDPEDGQTAMDFVIENM